MTIPEHHLPVGWCFQCVPEENDKRVEWLTLCFYEIGVDVQKKSRLVFGIVFLFLLLACLGSIGSLGMYGLDQTNNSFKEVYEDRAVPLVDLGLILDRMQQERLAAVTSVYGRNAEIVNAQIKLIQQLDNEIVNIWQKYMATKLTIEEVKLVEDFKQQWKLFLDSHNRTMILAQAGNYDAAIASMNSDTKFRFEQLYKTILKLLDLQHTIIAAEYSIAEERYQDIFGITLSLIIAGVLLTLVVGFFLLRGNATCVNETIAVIATEATATPNNYEPRSMDKDNHLLQLLKALNNGLIDLIHTVTMNTYGVTKNSSAKAISLTAQEKIQDASDEISIKIVNSIDVIKSVVLRITTLALKTIPESTQTGKQEHDLGISKIELLSLRQDYDAMTGMLKELIGNFDNNVKNNKYDVNEENRLRNMLAEAMHLSDILGDIFPIFQELESDKARTNQLMLQVDQNAQPRITLAKKTIATKSVQHQIKDTEKDSVILTVANDRWQKFINKSN